jgi:hypothetical protein
MTIDFSYFHFTFLFDFIISQIDYYFSFNLLRKKSGLQVMHAKSVEINYTFLWREQKGFLPSNIFFSFTVRFSEEVGLPFHLFKPYIFCLATIPFEFCLLNFQHPQNYIFKLFSFFGEYTDKLFYNYCCLELCWICLNF